MGATIEIDLEEGELAVRYDDALAAPA